jgi:hypothetical protein
MLASTLLDIDISDPVSLFLAFAVLLVVSIPPIVFASSLIGIPLSVAMVPAGRWHRRDIEKLKLVWTLASLAVFAVLGLIALPYFIRGGYQEPFGWLLVLITLEALGWVFLLRWLIEGSWLSRAARAEDGHCPNCLYDLRGNPTTPHCPECGEAQAKQW